MSTDQTIKWAFIGIIAIADLILLNFCSVELRWSDLVIPAIGGTLLAVMSFYYHRNAGGSLVLCMITLLHIGCFTTVVSAFMYMTTTFNFPLNDGWLRAFDSMLGYSPSALVAWTRSHWWIDHCSTWVYLFIIPQTMVMIMAVAFSNHRRRLERFAFQFMLGTFLCGVVACFFPASSPLDNHGFTPAEWQQPFLDHFHALRGGESFLFTWQATEGLVTFPSFHTAWAIFLILAWREQTSWLFYPMVILNLMIVLSTLTTGAHYLLDLLGGIVLAAFCIYASHRVHSFAYHGDGSPRIVAWLTVSPPVMKGQSVLQRN